MKSHLAAVSVINIAIGTLFLVLAVLVLVGVLVLAPAFNGAPPWKAEDAKYVFWTVSLMTGVFLLIGAPSLIAGIGLLKRKSWARVLAIVLAVLALPVFPMGTAVGLYTLWVLTLKEGAGHPETAA